MASLLEKTGKGMVCVGASSDKGKAAEDDTAAERRNSKHAMLSHFSRVEVRAGEALLSLYDYFATAVLQMASSDPIHNHTRAHVHTHTPTHLSTDATRGAASEMGNTGLGKNVVHGVSLYVGGVQSVVVQHVLHDDALEEEDVVMEEEEHMVIEQKDVVEEECHDDEMDIRNAGDTSDDMATHMALQLLNNLFPCPTPLLPPPLLSRHLSCCLSSPSRLFPAVACTARLYSKFLIHCTDMSNKHTHAQNVHITHVHTHICTHVYAHTHTCTRTSACICSHTEHMACVGAHIQKDGQRDRSKQSL